MVWRMLMLMVDEKREDNSWIWYIGSSSFGSLCLFCLSSSRITQMRWRWCEIQRERERESLVLLLLLYLRSKDPQGNLARGMNHDHQILYYSLRRIFCWLMHSATSTPTDISVYPFLRQSYPPVFWCSSSLPHSASCHHFFSTSHPPFIITAADDSDARKEEKKSFCVCSLLFLFILLMVLSLFLSFPPFISFSNSTFLFLLLFFGLYPSFCSHSILLPSDTRISESWLSCVCCTFHFWLQQTFRRPLGYSLHSRVPFCSRDDHHLFSHPLPLLLLLLYSFQSSLSTP